jgi:hypothetical protein
MGEAGTAQESAQKARIEATWCNVSRAIKLMPFRSEIPNNKLHIPNKHQGSKSKIPNNDREHALLRKLRTCFGHWVFGSLNLFGIWDLVTV